jgi:hypothetical protein
MLFAVVFHQVKWSRFSFQENIRLFDDFCINMDTLKKMKLFPDSWYRKMSKKEMDESRQQLKGYTLVDKLEQGLKEVFRFPFLKKGMYRPLWFVFGHSTASA